MIVSKEHYEEYKEMLEKEAVTTFVGIDAAAERFANEYNVSKDEARIRIESNTNADWVVSPGNKVYVRYSI